MELLFAIRFEVGGIFTSFLLELIVYPPLFEIWLGRRNSLGEFDCQEAGARENWPEPKGGCGYPGLNEAECIWSLAGRFLFIALGKNSLL